MSFDNEESYWAKENFDRGYKKGYDAGLLKGSAGNVERKLKMEKEIQTLRARLEVTRRNQLRTLADVLLEFKEDEPELFESFRDTHEASFVKIEKLIRKKRVQ